ncbi:MAG: heme-binding protein [Polaromonas sp.]|nr:heme-binding protein [Polaromonas sp.]
MNYELGRKLVTAATSRAKADYGRQICVAVCDQFGFLTAFVRMDDAPVRSIALAQQKAYTATRMGVSTAAFLARLRSEDIPIGYFCDPLLTALPGGALLTDTTGRVIGAIGVSGLTPAQDQEIADAGTETLSRYQQTVR